METDKTDLGDRMKGYELAALGLITLPKGPYVIRLDGHTFSTFTKGLARPYDGRLTKLMVDTTSYLVKELDADLGYTQSDEITLVFKGDREPLFGGRMIKLLTISAAKATAYFGHHLAAALPEKADKMPEFDSRVIPVPSIEEAYHSVFWRQVDATKNAISMAAQARFSHKQLMHVDSQGKIDMLATLGCNFHEYFPASFKRGTFVRFVDREVTLSEEEKLKIPEKYRVDKVVRSVEERFDVDLRGDVGKLSLEERISTIL